MKLITRLNKFIAHMGVGKIKLHEHVQVGNKIELADEIGLFLLGFS